MEWIHTVSIRTPYLVLRMVLDFLVFLPFFSRDCVFISGPAILSAEIQLGQRVTI